MAARKARKLSSYEPMPKHGSVHDWDVMQSAPRARARGRLSANGQKLAKTGLNPSTLADVQEGQKQGEITLCSATTAHQIVGAPPYSKIGARIIGAAVIIFVVFLFLLLTPGPRPV